MTWTILNADARAIPLADGSAQTCVTSPPYWGLRDYGVEGQLGLEQTPDEYVANMVEVFREVRRVLRDDGTVWLNLGDSYAARGNTGGMKSLTKPHQAIGASGFRGPPPGLKHKDLVGIPWRVAFALQADGWWLRSDIIWSKPNPMPESVTDRPTRAHEYIFLLSKSARYYYDNEAVKEPIGESMRAAASRPPRPDRAYQHDDHNRMGKRSGNRAFSDADSLARIAAQGRNLRSVWQVATHPYPGAHFATFPPKLIEPCIKAGSKPGDVVLDPFCGSGTTGMVALRLDRSFVGTELNPDYCALARARIIDDAPLFNGMTA